MLSVAERTRITDIAARYPSAESVVMPALDLLQRERGGHVSHAVLAELADLLRLPLARIHGVHTYYAMYNKRPVGRYHLQVDTNIPALLSGAETIVAFLKKELGIRPGETTPDGLFTLSEVEDLGSCGTCPVIQVNDRYYENMTVEKAGQLLDSLRRDKMPSWPVDGAFDSTCNILLRGRGRKDSRRIESYVADNGYCALEKALSRTPSEITGEVKDAVLRGRGGAGFPTGVKWGFVPKDTGKPVYLVCNADEGEPGTFKDRQIMEYDPHLLLEGMAIAGFALGAHLGFIYIRGEFRWIAEILERAVAEARKAGKLGKNILGKGFDFDIVVHLGAGAYVCGEETALIESIEGKRGNPRIRPPFPAVTGLYGCPTIVNNVETLASVPFIVREGATAFRNLGTPNNFGPKIYGISGHVKRPGVYEYPLGTPLEELLQAAGGVQGRLKAVIVGGLSVPILTADEARGLKMDYDSCIKHGTMLGSGGIIVMNETTSIPQVALRTIRFYAHESCGQCTPCREGSRILKALLRRLLDGMGENSDLDRILQMCATIKGSTLCPTGDAFAMPIEAMVTKFRREFEVLIT